MIRAGPLHRRTPDDHFSPPLLATEKMNTTFPRENSRAEPAEAFRNTAVRTQRLLIARM